MINPSGEELCPQPYADRSLPAKPHQLLPVARLQPGAMTPAAIISHLPGVSPQCMPGAVCQCLSPRNYHRALVHGDKWDSSWATTRPVQAMTIFRQRS